MIMKTSRAVVLAEVGRPPIPATFEPPAPSPGGLTVTCQYGGICGQAPQELSLDQHGGRPEARHARRGDGPMRIQSLGRSSPAQMPCAATQVSQ